MLRLIFRFFGFLFSWARDRVDHGAGRRSPRSSPSTARTCPTTPSSSATSRRRSSRIYSGQGTLMDEFARERRIFTPDRRDPRPDQAGLHLGRGQELLRAPRLRPARHRRRALRRGRHRRAAARRLDDHPAGDEELPPDRRPLRRAQDQGDHPRHPAREHALQGRDPRALPQRDLPRPELLRRHRRGADLLRQVARGADARRDRLPRGAAAGAERAAPGAREAARHRPAQLRARPDGATTATSPATRPRRPRPRTC